MPIRWVVYGGPYNLKTDPVLQEEDSYGVWQDVPTVVIQREDEILERIITDLLIVKKTEQYKQYYELKSGIEIHTHNKTLSIPDKLITEAYPLLKEAWMDNRLRIHEFPIELIGSHYLKGDVETTSCLVALNGWSFNNITDKYVLPLYE